MISGSCHDLCDAPLKFFAWATSEEPLLTARDTTAGTCVNVEPLSSASLQGWPQPASTTCFCLISFNCLYEVREMLSLCPLQNHSPALKHNKKQLCDKVPCGIDGMMHFWNSCNIVVYKRYQWALIRRHMAPELSPLVSRSVYIVLA